jgi:hypothetical protein
MTVVEPRSASASIDRHAVVFRQLLEGAVKRTAAGDHEAASVHVQATADYAWSNHPGTFASRTLETEVLAMGRALPRATDTLRRETGELPAHVLHVLTQAYAAGGHTRLTWRWMEIDAGRRHSVALSGQGRVPVPAPLLRAAGANGGAVHRLDVGHRPLLARASELRALAGAVDLVVIHGHPYDVVPSLAFADRSGLPPVVVVNHADHVFWLGASLGDLVVHFREGSIPLSRARRGISDDRIAVLPVPLTAPAHRPSRSEARRRLGIDRDALVLLTVGSGYKFRLGDDYPLLEALRPVLSRFPQAVLLAVGPKADPQWEAHDRRSGGRMRALGPRSDIELFHSAADICLDSYPVSSLTGMLEAGLAAVPAVRLRCFVGTASLLEPDDPGLGSLLAHPANVEELNEELARLLGDHRERLDQGRRTREAIAEFHLADGWQRRLDDLYQRAAGEPSGPAPSDVPETGPQHDRVDLAVAWMQEAGATGSAWQRRVGDHCRSLPLPERLRIWRTIGLAGGRGGRVAKAVSLVKALAPDAMLSAIASARRRAGITA